MNNTQKERYNRHLILSEIGELGQQKLLAAKVLVVGAGGLGSPILQYLIAAGIGHIGIMDADTISLSNLQRQVLYRESEIGKNKANQAKKSLQTLNSDVKIVTFDKMLNEENANDIISPFDIVIGATDNFESRLLIDKITKQQHKAFINGAIGEFEGQVSVHNYKGGSSYSSLFSEVLDSNNLPKGVMGVLPGIIGSLQACEAIKIICGIGNVLSNKLLIYNALDLNFQIIEFN